MFGGSAAHRGIKADDHRMLNFVYVIYFAALFTVVSSIIGLIIAYYERSKAQADINRSHATWQIRTFWLSVAFKLIVVCAALFLEVATEIVVWLLAVPVIFFLYRTAKGWYVLDKFRPIGNPTALL